MEKRGARAAPLPRANESGAAGPAARKRKRRTVSARRSRISVGYYNGVIVFSPAVPFRRVDDIIQDRDAVCQLKINLS